MNISVLVIDDEPIVLDVISAYLGSRNYTVNTAFDGKEGLELFRKGRPSVVLVDLGMPGISGLEVIESIRRESPDTPTIVVSGTTDVQEAVAALMRGAWDYIAKPFMDMRFLERTISKVLERASYIKGNARNKYLPNAAIGRGTSNRDKKNGLLAARNKELVAEMEFCSQLDRTLKESLETLKKTRDGVTIVISMMLELRDPYTAGHQRRVSALACRMAKEMGLSEYEIESIQMAAKLHDVGKICVPAEILHKPGRLSEAEFVIVKSHAQVAYDILKEIEFPWPIASIVHQHHERLDGSGYPLGISDENILLEARIIGVADVCEAMMSHRPYRPALGLEAALKELSENAGILYDTEAVVVCRRLFMEQGFSLH